MGMLWTTGLWCSVQGFRQKQHFHIISYRSYRYRIAMYVIHCISLYLMSEIIKTIKPWSHPPNASSNVWPNVPPLKGLSCNPMPHARNRRETPWRAVRPRAEVDSNTQRCKVDISGRSPWMSLQVIFSISLIQITGLCRSLFLGNISCLSAGSKTK